MKKIDDRSSSDYKIVYRLNSNIPDVFSLQISTTLDMLLRLMYTQIMASIQKVKVGRYTYYRIVESRRVNGKPRPVPVLHLGTADQLLQRLLAQSAPYLRVRSYQHGDVAALTAMADRLDLVALIDRYLPYARRPLSIGTTLLLAALNRAIWPCSKRSWAQWAERTSVPHLCALQPAALTRQYFWDRWTSSPRPPWKLSSGVDAQSHR